VTIDDRRLDELLADASHTYRVPPEPALDAIWERVAAEAFTPPVRRSHPGWLAFAGAIAASLVIGVVGGRASARSGTSAAGSPATSPAAAAAVANSATTEPYHRTTRELLGRTAVLLTSFPAPGSDGATDTRLIQQASQLLTTTRLLLDSPVGQDRRMKELLQDLELVLAQVARLRHSDREDEIALITQAMEERDVLPRLRTAVTGLSISDH
jgi:hypothetical protein